MKKIMIGLVLVLASCGPVKVQVVQDEQSITAVVDANAKVLNEALVNLNAVIKVLQEKNILPKPEEKK